MHPKERRQKLNNLRKNIVFELFCDEGQETCTLEDPHLL